MQLDTAALVKLARAHSRAEFVAALPYLFLVVNTPEDSGKHQVLRALTATVDSDALLPPTARGLEIHPLRKAANSAHPERVSIGRSAGCDVVLRDSSVSKLHSLFRGDENDAQLTDFESRNGTRVNGDVLTANTPTTVRIGDHLQFGRLACRLLDAGRVHDLVRTLGSLQNAPPSLKRDT